MEIDDSGRISRIAGKPEGAVGGGEMLHFPGIHILEPEFIQRIGPGFSDINGEHYPGLIRSGAPVFGWRTAFGWHDLGTPARFLAAAEELLGRESSAGLGNETVLTGADCEIAPSAVLRGPLELGAGCRIGECCRVEKSVLGDQVVLEDGAVVSESLLGDRVKLRPGVELHGAAAAMVDRSLAAGLRQAGSLT
ncbi:UTP--glucose-1-phosphate uridylyltransferase [subsurface metagenome]